ncbi:ABC transporter permease [Mycobacterium sp. 236(2023)]|uniref:ABC transporter permease n=1 Tax=Mycobacterium sp. 236(2023) TaxID=3038163 RepID=UPI002415761C|nr:ABC transporter permease [Mycobacterium sp. 236(2023)]MDG4667626.1 ABC transporter permease [Mycobacterium sp. 236(2023)]
MSRIHRTLGIFGWISIGICIAVLALAVFGPVIAPHDPLGVTDHILAGPSAQHLLGTDYLGRDVLSRILYGSRLSVFSALEVAGVAFLVGVPAAVLSVYSHRSVEWLSLRIIDTLIVVPFLVFAVAVTQLVGNGLHQAMIVVGVLTSPLFYRVTRAACLAVGQADYVHSARLYGGSTWYVVRAHILPKIIAPVLIAAANTVATGLIIVSSLTFLGIGIVPPAPTWGGAVSSDLAYLGQRPYSPLVPTILIAATVIALNSLADIARQPSRRGEVASGLFLLRAKGKVRA